MLVLHLYQPAAGADVQAQHRLAPGGTTALWSSAAAQRRKRTKDLPRGFILSRFNPRQGKSSLGPELLMATEPRLDRKVLVSTGFQKLHFHSYHPPPNPAAAFVAAFVRTLLQMKTDE